METILSIARGGDLQYADSVTLKAREPVKDLPGLRRP